jgi:hypothetical protein
LTIAGAACEASATVAAEAGSDVTGAGAGARSGFDDSSPENDDSNLGRTGRGVVASAGESSSRRYAINGSSGVLPVAGSAAACAGRAYRFSAGAVDWPALVAASPTLIASPLKNERRAHTGADCRSYEESMASNRLADCWDEFYSPQFRGADPRLIEPAATGGQTNWATETKATWRQH